MGYLNDAAVLNAVLGLGYDNVPDVTETKEEVDMYRAIMTNGANSDTQRDIANNVFNTLASKSKEQIQSIAKGTDWNAVARRAISDKMVDFSIPFELTSLGGRIHSFTELEQKGWKHFNSQRMQVPENRIDDIKMYINYLVNNSIDLYPKGFNKNPCVVDVINDYLNGKLIEVNPQPIITSSNPELQQQQQAPVQQPKEPKRITAKIKKKPSSNPKAKQQVVEVLDENGNVVSTNAAEIVPLTKEQQIAEYEKQLTELKRQVKFEKDLNDAKSGKKAEEIKQETAKKKVEEEKKVKKDQKAANSVYQQRPQPVPMPMQQPVMNPQQLMQQMPQPTMQQFVQQRSNNGFNPAKFIQQPQQQAPVMNPVQNMIQPPVQAQQPVVKQEPKTYDDPMPGATIEEKVIELKKHYKFLENKHTVSEEQVNVLLSMLTNDKLQEFCKKYKSACRTNNLYMTEVIPYEEEAKRFDFVFKINCKDKKHYIRFAINTVPYYTEQNGWMVNVNIEFVHNHH